MTLRRREVLKRIVGATAVPLVVPFSRGAVGSGGMPPAPPIRQLNVLFHGLFAMVVWSEYIEVLVPDVEEHRFLAGTWLEEGPYPLSANQTYSLEGAASGSRPVFDPDNHPVFHNWYDIDARVERCRIILPFPNSISALRPVLKESNQEFFMGLKAPLHPPNMVPLVTGLTYTVSGPVALRPLGCHPRWDATTPTTPTANLHIWAEPDHDIAPSHPVLTFEQFKALFRIPKNDLTSNDYYKDHLGDIAHDVGRPLGVNPDEEESLTGRRGGPSHAKFTSPANCATFIVYNP